MVDDGCSRRWASTHRCASDTTMGTTFTSGLIELDDVDLLVQWVNDPDNWRTLGRSSPINRLREKGVDRVSSTNRRPISVWGLPWRSRMPWSAASDSTTSRLQNRSAVFGILIGDRSKQGHRPGRRGDAPGRQVRLRGAQPQPHRAERVRRTTSGASARTAAPDSCRRAANGRRTTATAGTTTRCSVAMLREDWDEQQEGEMAAQGSVSRR
jgi:hypothetical protein